MTKEEENMLFGSAEQISKDIEDIEGEFYECLNPQVKYGSLCCDGNCWICGYHQLVKLPKLGCREVSTQSLQELKQIIEDFDEKSTVLVNGIKNDCAKIKEILTKILDN